jgi:serine/threonine-protein kinase
LPARTAAAVALQIAEALRAAHERGVIHRDIKPHNILITESGDVKVTDFGIARAASSSTMTRTGSILGTAHYISPEQAMGEPVGPSSDLYSLGVVLYEMLTGELPYDADTPLGIAMKHVNGHLRPPKAVDPSIPAGINAITCRLLAKDPEDRYASDAELIEDLERVAAGLAPAIATTELMTRRMPTTSPTRVGPPPPLPGHRNGKRRRYLPAVLALMGLLLLAALAWAGSSFLQPTQQEASQIAVPDLVGKTLDEAEDQAGDDFEIEVQDEVEDEKPVDTILRQDPEGGRAEKGSTISVVVVGTQVADVPRVVGKGPDAAEQALGDAGFEVATQQRESSFEEEGLVISQDPSGGSSQEVGSVVTITMGTGPNTVEVPDLFGNTPDQAAEILAGAELELGEQTEDLSDEVTEGQIFEQQPAAGADVEPGSEVSVTVSTGPELSTVPDVVGLSAEEAQAELWNAYFASEVETVPSDEPEGTVVSTDPAAGTQADWETVTVTVNVSAGPAPEPRPQPDNSGPGGGGPGGGGPGNGGNDNQRDNRGNNEDRGRGRD